MKKILLSVFALMLTFMFASVSFALDARDGIPAPPGTFVLVNYYQYLSGHKQYKDGKKISDNYDVNSTIWTIRPTYYGKVGQFPWVLTAFFTWGDKEADLSSATTGAPQAHLKAQGMADLRVLAAFWPYSNYQTKFHVVTGLYVTAPTGDYQNNRVLGFNMGANWWSFQPELGFIKGFGPFYVQVVGGAYFYTDNSDYGAAGRTYKKEPNYYGEAHFSYDVNPKFWIAATAYYMYGGRTKVEGVGDNYDLQQDWTLGLAAQYRILPEMAVMFATKPKIHTENGSDAAANIYIKISYFF